MSTSLLRQLTGVAGAVLCTTATAQTANLNPVSLDPITVTASRTPQPLSSALGDVTVIDADTIERAGQSSLADLLQREHGIDVTTNGGPQTVTSVFIRGANSGQTVFLIDGQRIGSSTSGGAGINAVALSQIERIEILRGPASGLYGADAIGGVINIITKRGQGSALNLSGSIGLGTWNTRRTDVGLSGAQGPWNYALSVGHARSDGFSATKASEPGGMFNPDRDGYRHDYSSGRLGFAWAAGQELEASFYQSRINGQYDGSPSYDERAIQRLESVALASNNRISANWLSRLRFGSTSDESISLFEPSPWSNGRADFRTRQTLFSWQNDFTLARNQTLSVAAERREENVVSDSSVFNATTRNTNSAVAVYRADLGRNHLQGNLRLDHVNGYGSRTTGGLSYAFDITRALQLTAGANTGFRLPTFNDLYGPFGSNPDLRPETSKNVEAGLRYREGGTDAAIVVYRNRIENLIQYQRPTVVNRDATIKGVTLTAGQQWGATSVRGSVDITDPQDENTGQRLARRARQAFKLAADHRVGPWRVGAEWIASGRRLDASYNASIPPFGATEVTQLGGYSLVNLTASYDITRNAQVQVRWNNVGNKDYELARGYNTPGSNVFVNLAYRP